MSMKRLLAGLATACCMTFGVVPGAASLPLDEFDRLVHHQQENFLSTVLHFYYYNYKIDPSTVGKAKCMSDLDKRTADDGDPYLLALIMRELDAARAKTANSNSVEGVVKNVIDRECRLR